MTDPLIDAAEAFIQAGIDPDMTCRILSEIRRRWAGVEVYIRAHDPAREQEIQRRLQSGERPREIARRVGVSVSTIRRRRSEWLD